MTELVMQKLANATQLSAQQHRVPTVEPHYTKKDDNMMNYLSQRCHVYAWIKNEDTGKLTYEPVEVKYQDILDIINTRLSHLESVSYLSSAMAEFSYSKWRLTYFIIYCKYESIGDQDALNLLRDLDGTIISIYWGRAHEGTHQKYDAAVAGSRRTMTIENGERQGGILGRFRK
jgi:hypothetical protein